MPRSAARRHNRYPENTCTEEPTTTKALDSSTATKAASLIWGARFPPKKPRQALGSHRIGRSRVLEIVQSTHRSPGCHHQGGGIYRLSLIDPIERFYGLLNLLSLIPMAASSAEHGLDRSMEVQHRMVTCGLVQDINVLSDAFSQ